MAKRTWQPKTYSAYRFLDKDPEIDRLRTMIADEYGRVTRFALNDIEANGGPSSSATHNWFFGDTKRPQGSAQEALGRSMGYKRDWVRMDNYKKTLLKRNDRLAKRAAKKNGHAK